MANPVRATAWRAAYKGLLLVGPQGRCCFLGGAQIKEPNSGGRRRHEQALLLVRCSQELQNLRRPTAVHACMYLAMCRSRCESSGCMWFSLL